MATYSPSSIDPLLLTRCLSIIGSTAKGTNRHALAPQGPGLPRHEPTVNPTAVFTSQLLIRSSIISLDNFSCCAFLDFDEPRSCQYSGDFFVGWSDSRKLNSFSKLCREMCVLMHKGLTPASTSSASKPAAPGILGT